MTESFQTTQTTRGRIIQHLARGEATVNDLAALLDLTDNAIRAQLTSLERDGLVRQSGSRAGLRKPNALYSLTDQADRLFPQPYGPILSKLLEVLGQHLPEAGREQVLREAGRRLAQPHLAGLHGQSLPQRLEKAIEILAQLGGQAELRHVHQGQPRPIIQGCRCPLRQIVPAEPKACLLAESLLTALLGTKVNERCQKGPTPRCCFEVET